MKRKYIKPELRLLNTTPLMELGLHQSVGGTQQAKENPFEEEDDSEKLPNYSVWDE